MRSRYLDIEDRNHDLAELLRDEPAVAQEFLKKYELSWVYHENALEGLVFSPSELASALESKPLAEASSLFALRDVRNFKAAIDLVRSEAAQKKPRITLALAKKLHETLHAGNEARAGADLRKEIPLHRAYFHDIAPPARIPALLDKLLAACDTAEFRHAHVISQASRLHHGFMQIFPYTDGSGKIARLLANLLLVHDGYQPCIIHTIDRQRYYESLKQPESSLRELMLDSMENGLANAEKLVQQAQALRSRRVVR